MPISLQDYLLTAPARDAAALLDQNMRTAHEFQEADGISKLVDAHPVGRPMAAMRNG